MLSLSERGALNTFGMKEIVLSTIGWNEVALSRYRCHPKKNSPSTISWNKIVLST